MIAVARFNGLWALFANGRPLATFATFAQALTAMQQLFADLEEEDLERTQPLPRMI